MTRIRAFSITASLLFCATTVAMVANPNPNPVEQMQPDGTLIQLFLKGHPVSGAFMTDAEGHPVVRDEQGWYVYGAHQHDQHIGGRKRLLASQRRVGDADPEASTPPDLSTLWHDNEDILKSPAYHFEDDQQVTVLTPMNDLLCEGMERTPWCPNNPVSLANLLRSDVRTKDVGGTLNIIVVLVRFADHLDRELLPKENYEALFNSDVDDPDINPSGSVKKYYNVVSNGKFNVQATVVDWITIPQTEEEMSFGKNGLTNRFAQTATLALQYMEQQMAPQGRSWSEYDRNNDGEIDGVFIVSSGYAAEVGGTDCVNNKAYGTQRIWSHRATAPDESEFFHSADGTVRIGSYATTSGFMGSCGDRIARIGVICHEMGHMLGLPDMVTAAGSGVGVYDIMGQMWGVDGTQFYPPLMGAYSRQVAGWVEPKTLTSDGIYEIGSSANYGDVFRIDAGFPSGEYLLIENRQALFYDKDLPSTGLLIWHVDDNYVSGQYQTNPGWPGQPGWPMNGNHYQLAVLQADGLYDLEQGLNGAGPGDLFAGPGAALVPGPGNQIYQGGIGSYPNSDSYSGGNIRKTDITISDIGASSDFMSFRLSLSPSSSSTPSPTPGPTSNPTPGPTPDPTFGLTAEPTPGPTREPTPEPTREPTPEPTVEPTLHPTREPSRRPTLKPSPGPTPPLTNLSTTEPTVSPTMVQTPAPTPGPTATPTEFPTQAPSPLPSLDSTNNPTRLPTMRPTRRPTPEPTPYPSMFPVPTDEPTPLPTPSPTISPSESPTKIPTSFPTQWPSVVPTVAPSRYPTTKTPTIAVTSFLDTGGASLSDFLKNRVDIASAWGVLVEAYKTEVPSATPSSIPTSAPPSMVPTGIPSLSNPPSAMPSLAPTFSSKPSSAPSFTPSALPSALPSFTPSATPSFTPTQSKFPSSMPSGVPSSSRAPTLVPTGIPSTVPTGSAKPSISPSSVPTISLSPTTGPSATPTFRPSGSFSPTEIPSGVPSSKPTSAPSVMPSLLPTNTYRPSEVPSGVPTENPSSKPSVLPSLAPSVSQSPTSSFSPSLSPSVLPSASPSKAPSLTSQPSTTAPSYFPTLPLESAPSPTKKRKKKWVTEAPSSEINDEPTVPPTSSPTESPTSSPTTSPSSSGSSAPVVSISRGTGSKGTISGHVFLDVDNDGIGDNPLAYAHVDLLNVNGDEVLMSVGSGLDGSYAFFNIPPGDYEIRQTDLVGFEAVSDSEGDEHDNTIFVSVRKQSYVSADNDFVVRPATDTTASLAIDDSSGAGTSVPSAAVSFSTLSPAPSSSPLELGTISGYVFLDVDNDGIGYSPLEFARIDLYPAGTDELLMSASTELDGTYSFVNVDPGEYDLVHTTTYGFEPVSRSEGEESDNKISVDLQTSALSVNNNFVDRPTAIGASRLRRRK